MQSDQELFAKGLATYGKVVGRNYMAHREVYRLLHELLVGDAPDRFVFLDIACGTAKGSAEALMGTDVARYIGIDISQGVVTLRWEEARGIAPYGFSCGRDDLAPRAHRRGAEHAV